ncbi:hypothetical protein [Flavilitoribacter nigricans]|uniref:Uncharacterized protein n=1 Tax=Flavilitoribacter nigricans (strain ATCC 23147 / DSM 23189 / NBRC 102662 / NCIMB 1420 / SS-2) TaxID=1122177 RepID=A0A2D0MXE5_FLAN2|nr:hypothetical protein [Flavilitoribacter nigricans]PHN00941.1 hypothetical protein CRP01_39795 [Flavilitoribacter nigricans DSM 23189 = NBRC 102662]
MKLTILNKKNNPLWSTGIDNKGDEYRVIDGHFFLGETISVEPYHNSSNTFIHPKLNYDSVDIFSNFLNKEGLIHFKDLSEVNNKSKPFRRLYELNNYWVSPVSNISNQIEYLYHKKMIDYSRFKIGKPGIKQIRGRASIISINYSDLLQKVLRERKAVRSWYFCDRERDLNRGQYADLFVLGNFNEPDLQIQLWQIIGGGSEILFAHGLIDKETLRFNHFDLATHYVDPNQIPQFANNKKRLDLIKKEKWIRIDHDLGEEDIFSLIKMFFPMNYLIDEFIEYPVLNIV